MYAWCKILNEKTWWVLSSNNMMKKSTLDQATNSLNMKPIFVSRLYGQSSLRLIGKERESITLIWILWPWCTVTLFDQSPLHKLGRADCLEIENPISSTQLQRISTGLRGDIKGLKTSVVKNDVESNCDFKELLLDERGAGVDCAVVVLFYFK